MGPVASRRVLDLGSGDGLLTTNLATMGAFAVGLDIDRAALRVAATRGNAPGDAARYVEGRIEQLPFRDATFDVVVAVTVLCLVPDRPTVVREAARVLRPGGRLIVGDLGRWNLWAAKRRVKGWLGPSPWRSARFSSAADLVRLVQEAELTVERVCGSVYYPPVTILARPLAHLDSWIGSLTTVGAAFIAVAAAKGRRSG
jgi:ubiquinone/menaquinone biosynthesis C-methylase UbiE